MHIKFQN